MRFLNNREDFEGYFVNEKINDQDKDSNIRKISLAVNNHDA